MTSLRSSPPPDGSAGGEAPARRRAPARRGGSATARCAGVRGSRVPLRLKVETNTREHFALYGLQKAPFAVSSRWFEGACDIQTYALDELLGTKLRALYRRKQARDLFDLRCNAIARRPFHCSSNAGQLSTTLVDLRAAG